MKIATIDVDVAAYSLVSLRIQQTPGYNGHRSLSRGFCHLTEWFVVFDRSAVNRLQFETARIQNHEVKS